MPSNVDYTKVTILPKNGAFYLEVSYELPRELHDLDPNQALSIDLGTSKNLAACVDTLGNSLLIDASAMKAMNQLWNKKVALLPNAKVRFLKPRRGCDPFLVVGLIENCCKSPKFKKYDIAVLKFSSPEVYALAQIRPSTSLSIGSEVFAARQMEVNANNAVKCKSK